MNNLETLQKYTRIDECFTKHSMLKTPKSALNRVELCRLLSETWFSTNRCLLYHQFRTNGWLWCSNASGDKATQVQRANTSHQDVAQSLFSVSMLCLCFRRALNGCWSFVPALLLALLVPVDSWFCWKSAQPCGLRYFRSSRVTCIVHSWDNCKTLECSLSYSQQ
jgi:hypothetical protein